MNWRKKSKLLSLLLAVFMLAAVVPGFTVPVTAQSTLSIQLEKITDGNDNVFIAGEKVHVYFWANTSSPSDISITITNVTGNLTASGVEHNYDLTGKTKIVEGITYWEYELNVTVPNTSWYGILRVFVDDEPLTDLYIYSLQNVTLYSIGANKSIDPIEGADLIIGDKLQINATLEGPSVPIGYTLPTPGNATIYVPAFNGKLEYVTCNCTSTPSKWFFSGIFTLSKNGTYVVNLTNSLNLTKAVIFDSTFKNVTITALKPVFTLKPITNATNVNQTLIETATLSPAGNFTFPYNITVELTPGINWTAVGSNKYVNTSAENFTFLNGAKVKVVNGALGNGTIAIYVSRLGTVYTQDFTILPENQPASVSVNQSALIKGQSFKIMAAISNATTVITGNITYNVTLVYAEDKSIVIPTDISGTTSTSEYIYGTFNTSNMTGYPVGEYYVVLSLTNGTANYTTNTTVNIIERLTLNYTKSKFGVYYPGDPVVFRGTFLRTDEFKNGTNVFVKVYQFNGTTYVPTTNATVTWDTINMTAKTYNFTVVFEAPGEYRVIVNETDIPNVQACVPISISKFKVNIVGNDTATIPLGTSYMIQVNTTSPGNVIVTPDTPGILVTPVLAKPFNESTHTALWNVTLKATATTKPGKHVVNITVDNGEVAQFALNVEDSLTLVDAPKVVYMNDSYVTITLKTIANLSADDYKLLVKYWGGNETIIGAQLGPYNKSLGYRYLNVTWDVAKYRASISDLASHPEHYLNITDGWKSVSVEVKVVNVTETQLNPIGTVHIGQTVNITGTTLLYPGNSITIFIGRIDPENSSQFIWNITIPANIKRVDGKNIFEGTYTFDVPAGLYNITAKDAFGGNSTIQINVTKAITVKTDRSTYYPDGYMKICGTLDDVANGTVNVTVKWFGGSATKEVQVINGTYSTYYPLEGLPTGTVEVDATYGAFEEAITNVTIVSTPSITNVAVPTKPVKAGELFNITADTNLGVNGTIMLTIVKADNASVVKVDKAVPVGIGGKLIYTVNTTNWTAGYYNITLSKDKVNVTKQVYIYTVGPKFELSNLTVEPKKGVAPLTIKVSVNVSNIGDLSGNYTAVLYVNGEAMKNETVEVPVGKSTEIVFNCTLSEPGIYNVTVGNLEPITVNVTKATMEMPTYPPLSEYPEMMKNASKVYVAVNSMNSLDYQVSVPYLASTLNLSKTVYVLASELNLSKLNASDMVIAIGGPLVNPVTAYYQNISPVHMVVNGSNITITCPKGNITWTTPKPWWNATHGYFVIQMLYDKSGALVVTIYGTDADSTAAGVYYFATQIYPNIASYTNVSYIVGEWIDTNPGAVYPLPAYNQGDRSGFDPQDTIKVVYEG